MSKRIQEPVRVTLRRGGAEPAAFVWNEKRYTVQQVEAIWKEAGPWWDGEGERTLFRVTARSASQAGVYELCRDETAGTWMLTKMMD
jgi:hypothetical protein